MSTSLLLLSSLPLFSGGSDSLPATSPVPEPKPLAVAQDEEEEEEPIEYPAWSGTANFGLSLAQGNSENFAVNFLGTVERLTEQDRTTLNMFYNYAEQTDVETDIKSLVQRRAGADLKYDYFFNERMYFFGIAGVLTDTLANLDLRYYLGGGVGYSFIKEEDLTLDGEIGVTYLKEEFDDGSDEDNVTLYLSYILGWQITPTSRFDQVVKVFPAIDDFDDVYASVDSRYVVNLTESMLFTIQYLLLFDHTPAPGAKQADHIVTANLGWAF